MLSLFFKWDSCRQISIRQRGCTCKVISIKLILRSRQSYRMTATIIWTESRKKLCFRWNPFYRTLLQVCSKIFLFLLGTHPKWDRYHLKEAFIWIHPLNDQDLHIHCGTVQMLSLHVPFDRLRFWPFKCSSFLFWPEAEFGLVGDATTIKPIETNS